LSRCEQGSRPLMTGHCFGFSTVIDPVFSSAALSADTGGSMTLEAPVGLDAGHPSA
jgi:hypothetical protein